MFKRISLFFISIMILCAAGVNAHVCSDVLSGGSQDGCPDPQTVEYVSHSSDGNRITIISDITAKHVQFKQGSCSCTGDESDGCYDNDDYGNCNVGTCYTSGFTVQSFDFDVNSGDEGDLTFSSDPSTSYTLSDQQTQRFNIYVDIDSGAATQTFDIDIEMKGSLSGTPRPIYNLQVDWEADGCSGDGDCSGSTPYCNTGNGECVGCMSAGQCDDSNECTTDSCNSNSCSNVDVSDGTDCDSSGHCCSGTCDTSVGNIALHENCRNAPSCNGASWEYSPSNDGSVCGGYDCKVCSNGECSVNDDNQCGVSETCNDGTCVFTGCTVDGDCSGSTPYCNTGNGVCVACINDGQCDDSKECTTDTCSSNSCSNTNVADGTTCDTSGSCCSGTCDTSTGNTDYHDDCRTGPQCSGTNYEYSATNEGSLCGGYGCRECQNGYCNSDDDSRCSNGETCNGGNCATSGCTSDSECTGSTPYCNTGNGQCVQCMNDDNCDDSSSCTTDSCNSNSCSNIDIADGTTCDTGGYCCGGTCDTTLGNNDFHENCRGAPACNANSWEYISNNDGELCGGSLCRECASGYCTSDDSTRCNTGETCNAGNCVAGGCTSSDDCSGTTPFCIVGSGTCVACLVNTDCNDNNTCTADTCSSNACVYTNMADSSTCTGCSGTNCLCQTGVCSCVKNCTGKTCGDDGCGGSCGICSSYIEGSKCYDGATCATGQCTYTEKVLTTTNDCCEKVFNIDSSGCVQVNVPNSSKCAAGSACNNDCNCAINPCSIHSNSNTCDGANGCSWCSISKTCLPDSQVQCNDKTACYEGSKICNNVCRIVSCSGTTESCSCQNGECGSCGSGQICNSYTCENSQCISNWICTGWSACENGEKSRSCEDENNCGSDASKPAERVPCSTTSEGSTNVDGLASNGGSDNDGNTLSGQQLSDNDVTNIKGTTGDDKPNILGTLFVIIILGGGIGYLVYSKKYEFIIDMIRKSREIDYSKVSPQQAQMYKYIEYNLQKNYTKDQIKDSLLKSGWAEDAINEAFKKIK